MTISPVKIWRRQKKIKDRLGKSGTVITWTRIFVTSDEFKKNTPYIVVMVKLDGGKRAYGQLVDVDSLKDIRFGMKVQAVLRKVRESSHEDVIAYGIKFKPV